MLFQEFSHQLEKIELIASRIEKTQLLSELFGNLQSLEVAASCYLMQGRLVPQYQSLEFQLSEKMLLRALSRLVLSAEKSGPTNLFGEQDDDQSYQRVLALYKKVGDLGQVAQQMKSATNETSRLELTQVFQQLIQIAQASGVGSQETKIELLVNLFNQLDPLSARYITRVILGKMRLGFSTMTMIDALSWAVTGDKSESASIEAAWQIKADIGQIARDYLNMKENQAPERKRMLAQTKIEVGIPVMPALCQRLNTTSEMIEKMGEVLVEPKYDGLRIQLHFNRASGMTELFTRSLENVTHMFPEVQQLPELLSCESCVLDAEAIGVDAKSGELKAFQETITRKRKHNVASQAQEVPIKFFVFDLLSLNGQSLINLPLIERKRLLQQQFVDNEILIHAPFQRSKDANFLRKYHEQLLAEGLEGAVMKKVSGKYVSGRKGWRWVKIKEAEGNKGKLKDTLDVIMMGYYRGRGKRAEFGLGAILTGILNLDKEVVTIAKIGTGMSEDQLVELKNLADLHLAQSRPPQYAAVTKSLEPDAWLDPEVVLEIAADEITTSPTHGAGVALRFPRLIRIRSDKSWEHATTVSELEAIK